MFQNADSIKQAMYDELQNILSPDSSLRNSAEQRLNQLKFTEGYGVYLAEFTMNSELSLGLRQLAAVMLKKYIENSWSAGDDSQTCEQAKKMIKSILPNGLCDPNSKIRTSVAYTISTIASHDWPNNWMELFDIIVKCLSGNENSVHGAMQVLVEFTYELHSQIPNVGPIILSEVYRIFEAENVYSVKTRSCAVDIFKSLLKSIATYVESKEEQVAILSPVMDNFIQKMMISLSLPNGPNFQLKTSILKVFCYLLEYMPKFIQPHINSILTPLWQLMTQTADIYVKVVINQTVESPFSNNDDEDEIENMTTMILQMFEFIHGLIESKKFKQLIKNVTVDLIYIVIVYIQITEQQLEDWTQDPEKFVQDEEEQNVDYSVRVSAQDVLIIIGQELDKVLPALQEALSRHCCVADAEKNANNPHWWKIQEACMLAVSCFDFLIENNKEDSKFNLSEYLNMSKSLMNVDLISPFLAGRCLCLMSHFSGSPIYNNQLLGELLDLTTMNLASDRPIVTRICAVKAIQFFCENLKKSAPEKREVLLSKLGTLFDGVFSLIGLGKYNILNLLLETLHSIISFDEHFTASIQNKIIPLTIAIFLKHHEDRYALELVLELLKILSQNTFCLGPLQDRILPTLVSILNLDREQLNTTLQDRALDVLETIVRNCKQPLSDSLMETAFPAAVQCILKTDDAAVMQRGGKCLRAFVHVAPEQVCNFRNREGLNYIMQVTTMLLNPMNTEAASSVGELVITLISKAGNQLGENIYMLLKAVISKMQMVHDWDVVTNLILIFAHLFLTQMEALLNFLTTVPGPTGEPAITYIFSNWLSRHQSFYGFYVRKVSVMALCKVFEYGVTSKDSRLTTVSMKVIVTNPAVKAKTRSQYQNAQQCISIPILVKILQILISELADIKEMQQAGIGQDEEDTDDDSANDSFEQPKSDQIPANIYNSDDEDEEDNDPLLKEILDDPILQSDFDLTKFIQNFSRDDTFREFLVHLSDTEKEVLRSIQVNV